ncbi:hypothetical protein AM593_04833, partial [Mytilus galloprovincialis]
MPIERQPAIQGPVTPALNVQAPFAQVEIPAPVPMPNQNESLINPLDIWCLGFTPIIVTELNKLLFNYPNQHDAMINHCLWDTQNHIFYDYLLIALVVQQKGVSVISKVYESGSSELILFRFGIFRCFGIRRFHGHDVVSLFSIYEFDCPSGIFRPSFKTMDCPAAHSEILLNGPPFSTSALDRRAVMQLLVLSSSRFY